MTGLISSLFVLGLLGGSLYILFDWLIGQRRRAERLAEIELELAVLRERLGRVERGERHAPVARPVTAAPATPPPIVAPSAPAPSPVPAVALPAPPAPPIAEAPRPSATPPPLPGTRPASAPVPAPPLVAPPAPPVPAASFPAPGASFVHAEVADKPATPRPTGAPVPPPAPPASPPARAPAPQFATAEPAPPPKTLEQWISTLLLPAGITILLVAGVLFLGYAFNRMGPGGRLATGGLGAALAFASGVHFERKARYELLGHGLHALGWGLAYFLAFASHFVLAARIFEAPAPAIAGMLAVGAAAVATSLRYDNEWLSTTAFLLIELGLGLAAFKIDTFYTLAGVLVAALGAALLGWLKRWPGLLAALVPASWLVLALLRVPRLMNELAAPDGPPRGLGPLGVPVAVWLAFLAAVTLWRGDDGGDEAGRPAARMLAWFANVLPGCALMLGDLIARDAAADWGTALGLGLTLLAGGAWLARRGERAFYLLSATTGLLLLALVTPLRLGLGSHWVPILRLAGIEAVILAGALLRERWFRLLGALAFAFTVLEALARHLAPGVPVSEGIALPFRAFLLGEIALFALANTALLRGAWDDALEAGERAWQPGFYSACAALALGLLPVLEADPGWIGPALALLALGWAAAAWRFALGDFLVEAGLLSLAAALYALRAEVPIDAPAQARALLPLATVTLAFAAVYALARFARARLGGLAGDASRGFAIAHAVLATGFLALLVVRRCEGGAQAPVFAALALGYLLAAFAAGAGELLLLGGALTAAAAIAIPFDSWGAQAFWFGLPARSLSLLSTALLFHAGYLRARRAGLAGSALGAGWGDWLAVQAPAGALLGACTALAWLGKEFADGLTAPLFMLLALAYLALGAWRGWRTLTVLALPVALAAGLAVFLRAWPLEGDWLGIARWALSAGAAIALAFAARTVAAHDTRGADAGEYRRLLPGMLLIVATIPLCALLRRVLGEQALAMWLAPALATLALSYGGIARWRRALDFFLLAQALSIAAWAAGGMLLVTSDAPPDWLGERALASLALIALIGVHVARLRGDARCAAPGQAEQLPYAVGWLWLSLPIALVFAETAQRWAGAVLAGLALAPLLRWRFGRAGRTAEHALAAALLYALIGAAHSFTTLHPADAGAGIARGLAGPVFAAAALFAGYGLIRVTELRTGAGVALWGVNAVRLAWAFPAMALLSLHLWNEASGTTVTLWLGACALAFVAGGFLLLERPVRLSGLLLLCFCILKLFFHDLTGMQGLARVAAFAVMGLILLFVNWAYIRYEQRLHPEAA